ncbi:uncharacterized protein BDR25DRAFT_296663 [Lindgomyces ingoldianus]|uniref:Uncharacterized protein n=1 Tax=Lindgomyces ingoldianus TaxID=673940 RepID=A0ACB6QBS9_9PLEO|nr:uncharacterized protein BDR25DRAFT_296663 [Lindgomyces ingoldianus]KAF2464434.1 hypothetical protein BDR25DRAFT_296663 [Lindgomyces ingoldianus]
MASIMVTAQCLCKAQTFTTEVPASNFPLLATACHCDSCRRVTGALYSINLPWPEPRVNVDISKLARYAFSSRIRVFFCRTCSTPIFFEDGDLGDLDVFTGAVKNDAGDVMDLKIIRHIFVGDTRDGGASMWLRKPNADGSEAKRFKERSRGEDSTENAIPIRCHCKGVDLVLHRGNYNGKKREELPWFIDPKTHKAIAGFCACDSCRLSFGVDVCNWSFAELNNISYSEALTKNGKVFPRNTSELKAAVDRKDSSIGTLTYYASSPNVQRYFCGSCGACVFYAADDRPDIVDVAIGVLEASDGARAEGFHSWALGKVGSIGDTKGGWREGLMARVEKECEEWREQRGYPKNWRRVEREAAEAKGGTNY